MRPLFSCIVVASLLPAQSKTAPTQKGFLFSASSLLPLPIKRRESVDNRLDELGTQVAELSARVQEISEGLEEGVGEEEVSFLSLFLVLL